jgi:hypothetical protein
VGSFIVAAPSLHKSGRRYETDDYPIVVLPGWAMVDLDPKPKPTRLSPPRVALEDSRYGRSALLSELARFHAEPEGGRHDHLNTSAFRLGQLAAAGELTVGTVWRSLVDAGLVKGLAAVMFDGSSGGGWPPG